MRLIHGEALENDLELQTVVPTTQVLSHGMRCGNVRNEPGVFISYFLKSKPAEESVALANPGGTREEFHGKGEEVS